MGKRSGSYPVTTGLRPVEAERELGRIAHTKEVAGQRPALLKHPLHRPRMEVL
jgi:hypothetical protein